MSELLKKYLKGDPVLWAVFFLLCLISGVEMYSASSTLAFKAANYSSPVIRHVSFLVFGTLIVFLVHMVPYKYIRMVSYFLLVVSIISLVIVQFRGESANDATRWLKIGGVQFQPSELGKLSLIVVVADLIARIRKNPEKEDKLFYVLLGVTGLVSVLILKENFSTAALLFGIVYLMLIIGGISWKKIVLLLVIIFAALFSGYLLLKIVPQENMPKAFDRAYTWVNRIERFTDDSDEGKTAKLSFTDDKLQEYHGKIAIARGGVFGLMPGNSVQRDFLPQAYSDFIYSIIIEELGAFGGIFLIILFMVLMYKVGVIATKSKYVFPSILVMGLALMIVFQAFVSMAVATGLGPVTGQPMPMISRGGTSILITSIYFGVIFGVARQIKEEKINSQKPVHIDELD